jgi:cold shock CspA family protein
METTDKESPENVNTSKRYSGKVKWFNNKAGYGFITLNSSDPLDAELNNSDIFVHHSVIRVQTEQYKYLVQGEYVELSLFPAKNNYKYQASDVSGVGGGNLLCVSKYLNENNKYKSNNSQEQWNKVYKSKKGSPLVKSERGKGEGI